MADQSPAGDVVFSWSLTRGSTHLNSLLEGFSGYLQSDAYSVYDKYAREHEAITQVGCLAYVRRQFDQAKAESAHARSILQAIAPLYQIESQSCVRAHPPTRRYRKHASARACLYSKH